MRTLLWRLGGPGIVALVGLAFELLGDFPGSRALGYTALVTAVVWTVYLGWPLLKRWRPFTLVPADGDYPSTAEPVEQQADSQSRAQAGGGTIVAEGPETFAGRLKIENDELKVKIDELESRGLPVDMVAERHIRYHPTPISLADLVAIAGVDGAIMGFTFEHCILEGPGIITFRGPPPPSVIPEGNTGWLMVGPSDCRVEGAPETTLYEIDPGGVKRLQGVIQLVGPNIRNVTFRNLGFAGTSDELRSLREVLTFSEGEG